MPIAIQEDMLPGSSPSEKFSRAQALGAAGIEFWGEGLTARVPAIVEAMIETGGRAAAVNYGRQGRLLDPDPAERERALARLRQTIADAVDIQAAGVIVVPHYGGAVLPDLSPWKSAAELEIEMLYMHLRTLSDFAEALGVNLYLKPVNRYESHLFNRLDQMAAVTRRLNHPRVKIAADLFHMALEEVDPLAAVRAHADDLGYLHLADSNRRLPGQGLIDFAAAADALHEIGYQGWLTYECGRPGSNDPAAFAEHLPASLAHLAQAGLA